MQPRPDRQACWDRQLDGSYQKTLTGSWNDQGGSDDAPPYRIKFGTVSHPVGRIPRDDSTPLRTNPKRCVPQACDLAVTRLEMKQVLDGEPSALLLSGWTADPGGALRIPKDPAIPAHDRFERFEKICSLFECDLSSPEEETTCHAARPAFPDSSSLPGASVSHYLTN